MEESGRTRITPAAPQNLKRKEVRDGKREHLDFLESPADLIEAIAWEGIRRVIPPDLEEGDREVQIVR